jgi:hypothetical protein
MESQEILKKTKNNLKKEMQEFCDYTLRTDWKTISTAYKPISYDTEKTREFLTQRTGFKEIDKELDLIESEGLLLHDLNKVNVHQKLESLLKSKPIRSWREQQVRIIVWQSRAVAAIFSPIFKIAKERLKELLDPKILYADGYTPAEISARLRLVQAEGVGFLEDDGSKQDKRTEHEMLELEMMIYKNVLKVQPEVVDLWWKCHHLWRYKGKYIRGTADAMRQTGQATTAIGNVIVNLIVHKEIAHSLGNDLVLMLVLGDDNLMISKKHIDAATHKRDCAVKWNMVQEATFENTHGTFLQMLVGPNSVGTLQAAPDFLRLRSRFEVMNGVSNNPTETLDARTMSYCMQLGDTKGVREICKANSYPIEPLQYYDFEANIHNCAKKHKVTAEVVRNEYADLLQMMMEKKTHVVQMTHFTHRF